MLRFYYVILISIPFIVFYLLMADYYVKNRERYDEEQCYELAQKVVVRFKKNARIKTVSYGEEHLPQEGGYIMYSNHQGRKYIYFPEGGYDKNGNSLQDFRPGAFNCVKKAKAPIVPVAIYDSHIPFDVNSLRKVTTQVCFLEPIYYEEYQQMTTQQISDIVKGRIEECMTYLEEQRKAGKWNAKFYAKA